MDIPGLVNDGKRLDTVCELENDHWNSWFTQLEHGGSFHSYVSLPEGISRYKVEIYPTSYPIALVYHDILQNVPLNLET